MRRRWLGWRRRLQTPMPELEALQLFHPRELTYGASQTWTGDKGVHEVALKTVSDNAKSVARSQARLAEAVIAARHTGCSWRQIAKAAGVPFQSLHHRFAKSEARGSGAHDSSPRNRTDQTMVTS